MPDVSFDGRIKRILTVEPKEGTDEPETVVQIKLDGLPSRVVEIMRLVGKSATVTLSPWQRELPMDGAGAVQTELPWDAAKVRTVPPPEP